MYITETTENVIKIFEDLENKDDISKMKFLLYTFNQLNNNQVNDKNEANPNLIEDENLKIFNLELIGYSSNLCTQFLQYLAMLYNNMTESKKLYIDDGHVIGLELSKEEILINSYEKLNYNEKLDLFSELFIRYDNETYFSNLKTISFDSESSGFDVANRIKKIRN